MSILMKMARDADFDARSIADMQTALAAIQTDIRRLAEMSSERRAAIVAAPERRELLEVMLAQVMEDVEEGLKSKMVKRCEMKEPCRATFTGFLQKNASLMEQDTVREEVIITNQNELDRLRETAPYDKCARCFDEVSRLFGKQVRLMRSLRIYSTVTDKKREISEIEEGAVVDGILEPIANRQRLQILKAVSVEARTFSHLAEVTGLRGGNLLFHIQKLADSGIIIQRHERGDYMITEKGYRVLKGVSDVYQTLKA
jgi:DNA-binding transcriptional ArsR family regulator